MASMSYASARVTTSASRPSTTARACLPDPPCDWFTTTLTPVFSFQYLACVARPVVAQSKAGGELPRFDLQSAGARPARHLLVRGDVLGERAAPPDVPVRLRRQAVPAAVGHRRAGGRGRRVGAEREERLLSRRLVRRQARRSGRALVVAVAGRQA